MFAPLYVLSYIRAAIATPPATNERGASFTEYVVLIGAIVAVVTAGVLLLKGQIETKISGLSL